MIRDTKVMLAFAWFGGFFYWVAVGEFNSMGSDVTFFREPWVGYLVALGIAAVFGVLMERYRWLGGALVVLPSVLVRPQTTDLMVAVGSALLLPFMPIIITLLCIPPALVAEIAGRVFWLLRFFLSK